MYQDILSDHQKELLQLIGLFKREYMLVGGTAIALQVGHRRSIDFDLFKKSRINKTSILKKIKSAKYSWQLLYNDGDSLDILINEVKITFMQYPYAIEGKPSKEIGIKMPDLLTLAAMKFYALGRRAKWKDYVDIYFLIRDYFNIPEVSGKANQLFGSAYSEKLFRQQIAYFEDIDYSEPIDWIVQPVSEETIKSELQEYAVIFE